MIATSPLDLLRPFLWIAAVAFVLGFAGYALLGAGSLARPSYEALEYSPAESLAPAPGADTISA